MHNIYDNFMHNFFEQTSDWKHTEILFTEKKKCTRFKALLLQREVIKVFK